MRNKKLFDALDGLMAYDCGATDSGIQDDDLRQEVEDYLNGLSKEERSAVLVKFVMTYYLSKKQMAEGYGLEDVKAFLDWLDDETSINWRNYNTED